MNNVKDMVDLFRARRTEDTQKGPIRYNGDPRLCDNALSNLVLRLTNLCARILLHRIAGRICHVQLCSRLGGRCRWGD